MPVQASLLKSLWLYKKHLFLSYVQEGWDIYDPEDWASDLKLQWYLKVNIINHWQTNLIYENIVNWIICYLQFVI